MRKTLCSIDLSVLADQVSSYGQNSRELKIKSALFSLPLIQISTLPTGLFFILPPCVSLYCVLLNKLLNHSVPGFSPTSMKWVR